MGLFDKVKEKASDALEQGKEAAQTQQLKLQLRKLEGEVDDAAAAFGAAAFDLFEAGTLSVLEVATATVEARGALELDPDERTFAADGSLALKGASVVESKLAVTESSAWVSALVVPLSWRAAARAAASAAFWSSPWIRYMRPTSTASVRNPRITTENNAK